MTMTQMESTEVLVPATLVAQIEGLTTRPADIGAAVGKAFGTLYPTMGRAGLTPSGPPRVIYTGWGPDEVRFTVAAPIDGKPATPLDAGVSTAKLPERVALRFVHRGPYRDIKATYDQIESWLRERGGITTPADWAHYSPMWEEYVNDPATTPESELVTNIFFSLREQ
ncbi:MAG TPA: GyrI-like domain-containing protein [Gemmatimonadaceae bacterium]|nr:GyrI-like domain-containing protein [Gemmatimonadaceae bacterium]